MADGWPEIAVHEAGPFDVPVIAFPHAECCADGIGGGSLEPGRDRHFPVPARQLRLPGGRAPRAPPSRVVRRAARRVRRAAPKT